MNRQGGELIMHLAKSRGIVVDGTPRSSLRYERPVRVLANYCQVRNVW